MMDKIFQALLEGIPEYKEFLTVQELDESSRALAREHPESTSLFEMGKTREGRPLLCLKIGSGRRNALMFGCPHPNEPIGTMLLEYFSRCLAEDKTVTVDQASLSESTAVSENAPVIGGYSPRDGWSATFALSVADEQNHLYFYYVPNTYEVTFYHRELRPDAREMLQALKDRGYRLGVISNNASLYNVFNMLEAYGIRSFMEDVTVSSVTGYRKPHPEIFRISLRQMQARPEECVYVGDTVSRDIIGPKQVGFAKAVQIRSFLSEQKDVGLSRDVFQPDTVVRDLRDLVTWLDEINPRLAPHP